MDKIEQKKELSKLHIEDVRESQQRGRVIKSHAQMIKMKQLEEKQNRIVSLREKMQKLAHEKKEHEHGMISQIKSQESA